MSTRRNKLKFLSSLRNACEIISQAMEASWLIDVEFHFYELVTNHIKLNHPDSWWRDRLAHNMLTHEEYDYVLKIGKIALQKQVWILYIETYTPNIQLVSLDAFKKVLVDRTLTNDLKFIKKACVIKGYHKYIYSKKQIKAHTRKEQRRNKNPVVFKWTERYSSETVEIFNKWITDISNQKGV